MNTLRVLSLLIVSFSFTAFCYGQCDVKVEFSYKKQTDSNSSIYLKPEVGLKNVQVQLYDLYEGKIVKDRTILFMAESFNEIFKDVKPSLYYVYIKFDGCDRKGLGGVSGFKVGD